VHRSHKKTLLSRELLSNKVSSCGHQEQLRIPAEWPASVVSGRLVEDPKSYTLRTGFLSSADAVISHSPSLGLQATALTPACSTWSLHHVLFVLRSHTPTLPSSDDEARM
jgi:hypothetical protein